MNCSIEWAKVDLKKFPRFVTDEIPGPKSQELHGERLNT